jgi:cytochrome c
MKHSGTIWDDKTLDASITDPEAAMPGNVMPYSALTDAKQRADLVAYLQMSK